jgi:hypothetical protein
MSNKLNKIIRLFKISKDLDVVLFDLNELRNKNKRGEIGRQGVSLEYLLSFLSWAEIYASDMESIKAALSLDENKKKLWSKLTEVPIDIVAHPDETFWLRDGHHRAKLADLAGFDKIPAKVIY